MITSTILVIYSAYIEKQYIVTLNSNSEQKLCEELCKIYTIQSNQVQ